MHLPVDHDAIFRSDAGNDRSQSAEKRTDTTGRTAHFVFFIDHQHIALALVVANRRIWHENRVIAPASRHRQPGKQARDEFARFIFQNSANPHRAGRRIDMVVDKIDHAFVRKAGFVSQLNVARHLAIACAEQRSFLGELLIFQHRVFIDVDIAIDRRDRLHGGQQRHLAHARAAR